MTCIKVRDFVRRNVCTEREAVGLCRCKAITKVVRGNVFVPLRLRGHGKQCAATAIAL
jgi:hypothetical protein